MNSQSGFGCQESFFTLELQFQADLSLLAADLSTFLTSWTSSMNKKLEENLCAMGSGQAKKLKLCEIILKTGRI
jgi:hypothetical protein